MAVITGYKLICEWCGKKSEELWEISDPEKYLLRRECEGDFIPIYSGYSYMTYGSSQVNNCEAEIKKVFLPEDWRSKHLQKSYKVDDSETRYKKFLFWQTAYEFEWSYNKTEIKYIYFCCQDHKDSYERLKKNVNEDWE